MNTVYSIFGIRRDFLGGLFTPGAALYRLGLCGVAMTHKGLPHSLAPAVPTGILRTARASGRRDMAHPTPGKGTFEE